MDQISQTVDHLEGRTQELSIAAVRTVPVNVELEAPYLWTPGYLPGFTKVIVEVETACGIVGVGEAPSHWAKYYIDEAITPRLEGADPLNLVDCERRCLPPIDVGRNTESSALVHAYGGVEMALWDIAGKWLGCSVAQLLGGRVRDEVLFTEYFAPRLGREESPTDIAGYCARMVEEHGSWNFEGKVGYGDLDFDLTLAREVRSAVGDKAMIRLDANMGWSISAARHALIHLAEYDIRSVEDPVRSVADMRSLRALSPISLSSHDPNLVAASAWGVPDAIVVNLSVLGGIRRTVSFVNACEQIGIDVWFFSPDTGVANSAYLQVAAALEWLSEPSQTLLRWHQDDVIVGGPLQPRESKLPVPEGFGIAVELDPAAVQRCHGHFREHGPFDPYGHPSRPGRYGSHNLAGLKDR